jgi:cytochrome c biogenesis protein CcmG/thiol:disulfide interchange protein DsbE
VARRLLATLLLLALGACGAGTTVAAGPDLPMVDPATLLGTLDGAPAVVNVWASWCVPCRSEAPLLREAHAAFGDRVIFVGVAVQDTQADAAAFLAEFDLPFANYFDPDRALPRAWGGAGVPITYFVAGGEVVDTHLGVIDDRTLALGIDELLRR